MKRSSFAAALASFAIVSSANAAVTWTNWTSGTPSTVTGSASGTMGADTVTYTGEMECLNCFASNWSPASTWANIPPPDNSGIQLFGSFGATDVVSFSSPVKDPVLAIVSLGQSGITASFNFTASEAFTLLGGGPSSTWGGSALTRSGQTVDGAEGNGLVQFLGTYSSITWTNPVYEDYYAVTVGTSPIPEPSTWAMMLLGFVGLGYAGYRRARVA
jgi:hypothetical protein